MATHSSVLAWRIPGTGEPWWAAVYGVAQSRTRLKQLSSSSSSILLDNGITELQDTDLSQFSSVTQSRLTLCDPMDCSTPGSPVHHQLPKLAQTHVHRAGDAIQSSHPQHSQNVFQKMLTLFLGGKVFHDQVSLGNAE